MMDMEGGVAPFDYCAASAAASNEVRVSATAVGRCGGEAAPDMELLAPESDHNYWAIPLLPTLHIPTLTEYKDHADYSSKPAASTNGSSLQDHPLTVAENAASTSASVDPRDASSHRNDAAYVGDGQGSSGSGGVQRSSSGVGGADPLTFHTCHWAQCWQHFPTVDTLTQHVSDRHLKHAAAPYMCEWMGCDRLSGGRHRPFKFRHQLLQHVRVHTGELPFTCRECGARFRMPDYLRRHHRQHKGIHQYVCKVSGCNKAYNNSGDMWRHVNLWHPPRPHHSNAVSRNSSNRDATISSNSGSTNTNTVSSKAADTISTNTVTSTISTGTSVIISDTTDASNVISTTTSIDSTKRSTITTNTSTTSTNSSSISSSTSVNSIRSAHGIYRPYACQHTGCRKAYRDVKALKKHVRRWHLTEVERILESVRREQWLSTQRRRQAKVSGGGEGGGAGVIPSVYPEDHDTTGSTASTYWNEGADLWLGTAGAGGSGSGGPVVINDVLISDVQSEEVVDVTEEIYTSLAPSPATSPPPTSHLITHNTEHDYTHTSGGGGGGTI